MTGAAIKLFFSSAPEDEPLRGKLEKHLSSLRWQGMISHWSGGQILAGSEWAKEVELQLQTADLILLLVSADFLASNHCYNEQMQRAIVRHKQGEARVIPVLLRPCDWEAAPFGQLQPLPANRQPISLWTDQDAGFLEVVRQIRAIATAQFSQQQAGDELQLPNGNQDQPLPGKVAEQNYQAAVREYASGGGGKISPLHRLLLSNLRQSLELTEDQIQPLEREVLAPFGQYSQAFTDFWHRRATRQELKQLQADLGLSDLIVSKIEYRLAEEYGSILPPAPRFPRQADTN